MGKTVLILGAGFSYGASLPLQNDILPEMKRFYNAATPPSDGKSGFEAFSATFQSMVGSRIEDYLIEDIFTIFDRCLFQNESFRGINVAEIDEANHALLMALRRFLLDRTTDNFKNQRNSHTYYRRLANELLKLRDAFGADDKVSLISLNWDHYIEKTIAGCLPNHSDVALDYCTYDYSFLANGKHVPSIMKKVSGKRNLKILKPHGSVNWGYCSNCGRLYISYGKKIEDKFECIKYCKKAYGNFKLSPVLVTPTFLKDLSIRPLVDIWDNVGIELSEADHIIFVGYSLRPEDFYFRFMLSKFTKKKNKITVVEYCDPSRDASQVKAEIEKKFAGFFQQSSIHQVYTDGWEKNIDNIINTVKAFA